MRIRTILTFWAGAAVGAAGMYMLDPDLGDERRKDAGKQALASARDGAIAGLSIAKDRATEMASAAVTGFQEARAEQATSQGSNLHGMPDAGHSTGPGAGN